jgi:hypothetical protein
MYLNPDVFRQVSTCLHTWPMQESYPKSGNFGHGFILAPKYEVPKLNTPKYVTLQKLTTKIEHCLNIFLYLYSESVICLYKLVPVIVN